MSEAPSRQQAERLWPDVVGPAPSESPGGLGDSHAQSEPLGCLKPLTEWQPEMRCPLGGGLGAFLGLGVQLNLNL